MKTPALTVKLLVTQQLDKASGKPEAQAEGPNASNLFCAGLKNFAGAVQRRGR
jgi:hypothetical protein